ncbi:MAG TPA: hypothetical protein VF712_04010 [Thermoleophilaceae bacterium]
MGLFKNMKDAMGQANDAMAGAQQMQQQAEQQAGGISAGPGGMGAAVAARDSLQGQAQEQNRILTIGSPGQALIKGHVDSGENVAGNPVWIFDLEVTPEGGAPYAVQKREIVSSMAMGSYADGTSMACRIDPADPQKIAFGEKPFM